MKIVAAVLARTQSPASPANLLPQRPLASIRGRRVLEWIVERLEGSNCLDQIVIAVGHEADDSEIIRVSRQIGLNVMAGHPNSILHRLYMVAEAEKADHVVRINGNFPLVDVDSLDNLVSGHLENRADFSLNSHYHGIVYGLGVEVFSRDVLRDVAQAELTQEQQGIGSLYFFQNSKKYHIYFQPARITAPHLRVSVDFAPDLHVVSEILEHVPSPDNQSVVTFLESRPDLIASQEMTAPVEVSLEKALLFPEKIQALRDNNCVTLDKSYPISIELSLTNRCNHKCIWCSDQGLRERLGGELNAETLHRLLRDFKAGGTRGIVIEGGGEPTLHQDFSSVVDLIKDLGLGLGLITNGYLTPYINNIKDFEWIRFSLDAAGREDYRNLKGVDGFDRVINNLLSIASDKQNTSLGVGYVVTNRNDDPVQLEQLVLFLRKIGTDYIQFRPVVDHPELFSEVKLDFLKKYETGDFSVNIAAMTDNQVAGNSGLPCLAHSLSTVITADGGVYLCGRLNRFDTWHPLGNLHDQTFHEIWTGEKRRQQVRMVSQAEFCQAHCPQCRMTKYNRLLNDIERVKTRNFI